MKTSAAFNPTLAIFTNRPDRPFNGVDLLDPALTINSTTVYPSIRYKLGDASAAGLPCWGYGSTLSLQAGAAPTYNNGSPLLGTNDDSCLFNNGGYFAASDTTTGDITTEDFVVELVGKASSNTDEIIVKFDGTPIGWDLLWTSSQINVRIADVGGLVAHNSATLTAGCWYHCICFIDRSGSAQWYVNGSASGVADVMSGHTGSLSNATALSFGANAAGGFALTGNIAYVAMWKQSAWLDTHLQADVAAERFYRLTGHYPQQARGTALPVSARTGRNFDAHLDKVESSGNRKLYRVGAGWLRCCSRLDSAGSEINGYLSEPQATNFSLSSEDFTNGSYWRNSRTSDAANTAVAPNGTTTADTLKEDATAANSHYLYQEDVSFVDTTKYAISCWFKAANRHHARLACYDGSVSFSADFDLSNGTAGTKSNADTSGIEDWGDGWYRCWMSVTATNTTDTGYLYIFIAEDDNDATFDGLNQDSLYAWGYQFETGTYPTSYTPTTTAARTRLADTLEYKGDDGNLGGVGSEKQGTIKCDVLFPSYNNTTELSLITLSDGGAAADLIEITVGTDDAGDIITAATGGNAGSAGVAGDLTNNTKASLKGTWTTDSLILTKDSTAGTADTSITPPDDLDRIDISCDRAQGQQNSGIIADLQIYKRSYTVS